MTAVKRTESQDTFGTPTAAAKEEDMQDTRGREFARRTFPYIFGIGFPALGVIAVIHKAAVAVYLIYALVTATALLAERYIPWVPIPANRRWRNRHTDLAYLATAPLIMLALVTWVPPVLQTVRDWLFGDAFLWPVDLPTYVQAPMAVLVVELAYYWAHRISHYNNFLWRSHRVHHSPEGLDWLMSWRIQWLNEVIHMTARLIPFAMLGMPAHVTAIVLVISNTHALFPHANIDTKSGRFLNGFLNTPEVHRWHHLQDLRYANSNFGDVTLVWDRVFRTYNPPGVNKSALMGLPAWERRQLPEGYLKQLYRPLLPDAPRVTGRKSTGEEPAADVVADSSSAELVEPHHPDWPR
ncbi:sterol desaturase family protein [Streptomyces lavendulocolor]|uniref:sterol desaturase family protein n=1 Tax=Streptomyces lavendulocolor TaxID=67316 RepID=UPI0033E3CC0C